MFTCRRAAIAIFAGHALTAIGSHSVRAEVADQFLEIALRCPDIEGGTLELTTRNKQGQRDRITIIYDGDIAVRLEAATAGREGDFESYYSSNNPEAEIDADNKEFSDTILAKFGMLRRGVCLAPKNERERYFRMLERQEKIVGQ